MVVKKECQCCFKEKRIEQKMCVCDTCMETERGKVVAIREYTNENPGATIREVSEALKISYESINDLIKKDRVQVVNKIENYENEYNIIKEYIQQTHDSLIYNVSRNTKVPIYIINELVKQGRLIEIQGIIKVNESRGMLNEKKLEKLKKFRGMMANTTQTQDNIVRDDRSKLVSDLEDLKAGKISLKENRNLMNDAGEERE